MKHEWMDEGFTSYIATIAKNVVNEEDNYFPLERFYIDYIDLALSGKEEPSNMGAWTFIRHRLKQLITRKRSFGYIGRVSAGTTAEGSNKAHVKEQARIVNETWTLGAK